MDRLVLKELINTLKESESRRKKLFKDRRSKIVEAHKVQTRIHIRRFSKNMDVMRCINNGIGKENADHADNAFRVLKSVEERFKDRYNTCQKRLNQCRNIAMMELDTEEEEIIKNRNEWFARALQYCFYQQDVAPSTSSSSAQN